MTERELVAGLLSGRITPRDTAGIDLRTFQDVTLKRCFHAVETLVLYGFTPTTKRILVGFDTMRWDPTGIPELIEQLRTEG